jgi:hypothetical protein
MKLPTAPDKYDRSTQQKAQAIAEQADAQNLKRGVDIEMGKARVILTSPAGHRFALTVSDTGVVSTTAL